MWQASSGGKPIGAHVQLTFTAINASLCPDPMTWHIHYAIVGKVAASGLGAGNTSNSYCASTKGHWDPTFGCGPSSNNQEVMVNGTNTSVCQALYASGSKKCSPMDDITTCEMGDLSSVLNTVPAAPGTMTWFDPWMTNLDVVSSLSAVLHCPAYPGAPRVACMDFEEVKPDAYEMPPPPMRPLPNNTETNTIMASIDTEDARARMWMWQEFGGDQNIIPMGAHVELTIDYIKESLCPVPMEWHLHQAIPGEEVAASGYGNSSAHASNPLCAATGGHWDPTYGCGSASMWQTVVLNGTNMSVCEALHEVGTQTCNATADVTTCEMGDMSGVLGRVPATEGRLKWIMPWTNLDIVANLSVVFHCPAYEGSPRVMCMNFVKIEDPI
ncbi:hypothetical protein FOA52_014884 [Chlamydomonas sp. UWO 241]|nr:hypothetical protein FOA52_014884 [Chlamydomonas sp. UWO 241]